MAFFHPLQIASFYFWDALGRSLYRALRWEIGAGLWLNVLLIVCGAIFETYRHGGPMGQSLSLIGLSLWGALKVVVASLVIVSLFFFITDPAREIERLNTELDRYRPLPDVPISI